MRLYSSLLVTAIVLSAWVNASSTRSKSTFEGMRTPDQPEPHRLLQEANEDERAGTSLTEWIKLKINDMLTRWNSSAGDITEDEVFTFLKLNEAGDNPLRHENFDQWVKFVKMTKKDDPEAAMVKVLVARYGDDGLASMLDAASKVEDTKDIAIRLWLAHDAKYWINKQTSVEDVFAALGFNKAGRSLLRMPQFNRWAMYVELIYKDDPETAMVAVLTRYYGSDDNLEKMLTIWTKAEDTNDIATRLLLALEMKSWTSHGIPLQDVFTFLELNEAGENMLRTAQFDRWAKYAIQTYKDDPEIAIVAVLTRYYGGDKGLARMLDASSMADDTKDIAVRLWLALEMRLWMRKMFSVEDAFASLELDKAGRSLLRKPQFNRWVIYVELISKDDPETAMVAVLTRYYGGDKGLARMLEAFGKITATKELANTLQAMLMESWRKQRKSVDDVFNMFELNTGVDKLLAIPDIEIFAKFLTVSSLAKPDTEALVTKVFRKFYGDEEVGKMLEAAKMKSSTKDMAMELQLQQFQQWLMEGKTPDTIAEMVGLHDSSDTTVTSLCQGYQSFYDESHKPLHKMDINVRQV